MTVVVRGKGDCDAFVAKFWENWRGRAWEESEKVASSSSNVAAGGGSSSSGLYSSDGTVRMVGVSGILRKEQEMWESTDKSLQDAFQDLNALMVMSLCFVLCFLIVFVYETPTQTQHNTDTFDFDNYII